MHKVILILQSRRRGPGIYEKGRDRVEEMNGGPVLGYKLILLTYLQMNRPFGAVDVSANLKGTVPKAATQKILVSLAEKGDIVQKTYGMALWHSEAI